MTSPNCFIIKLKTPNITNEMASMLPSGSFLRNSDVKQSVPSRSLFRTLELIAGALSTSQAIKGERSAALKQTAEEVKDGIFAVIRALDNDDLAQEYQLAASDFDDRAKRIEREERIKSATKKASSMKMSVEEATKGMDDKELNELQTKLKEVEQIIGKKRKASEVNE